MHTSEWNDDELSNSLLFGSSKATGEIDLSFLDPPKSPDEIGRLGDFRVLRVLGKGGMGIVFEAEDRALQRNVALKVLHPLAAADRDCRERFLREARAVASLASDYVVTVFQVGVIGKTPYLEMQLLQGQTLQQRLERPPPLAIAPALLIARQVAAGLADVHQKKLIHRDVKPANIWLEADEPQGDFRRVRLLDFGLARRSNGEPGITSTGTVVGTPWYMSPEQARGEIIDSRADLFSLGCVLYMMLTGELAFPGESTMTVFAALANHTPQAASIRNPAVPPAISELITRLIAKNRNDRPGTAAEVVEILDSVIADLSATTSLAKPPPRNIPAAPDTQTVAKHDTQPDRQTGEIPLPVPPAPESRNHWRWKWTERIVGSSLTLAMIALAIYLGFFRQPNINPTDGMPIIIGILHSKTGYMAASEEPVINAAILAVDEINQKGGVLGRKIRAIVADGRSDPAVFQSEAIRLIKDEQVVTLIGCWTSASRKAVIQEVERENNLLFYPIQYEGLEQSPQTIYLGPTPNQQMIPALEFLARRGGPVRRIALIGSDYVYPRAVHEQLKDWAASRKDIIIAKAVFVPLGTKEVSEAVDAISSAKPDLIINLINGSTNFQLFPELDARKITAPVLSLSISENELQAFSPSAIAGDYIAASYFQSVDRVENREFIRKLNEKYGKSLSTEMMVGAYASVHLWAKAVAAAGVTDPLAVARSVRNQEFNGPRGRVKIDADNGHAWLPWRLGQIQPDGKIKIVAESNELQKPEPFPNSRPRADWERYLYKLKVDWDNHWQAPAAPRTNEGKE